MAESSAQSVMALYAERINAHRSELVAPLIAPDAVFWFGDGSHNGLASIQLAFEATWAALRAETYWLEDLRWLASGASVAVCCYRFFWTATVEGVRQSGGGRGTSVLERQPAGWLIVHEHLSSGPSEV